MKAMGFTPCEADPFVPRFEPGEVLALDCLWPNGPCSLGLRTPRNESHDTGAVPLRFLCNSRSLVVPRLESPAGFLLEARDESSRAPGVG